MKILIVTNRHLTGLNYHRQLMPHEHLAQNYTNVEVKYAEHLDVVPDEDLKTFNIVQFLRQVSLENRTEELINRCKKSGCKVVFDIDDFWQVPKSHDFYNDYIKYNIPKQVVESIKQSDLITTTTPYFADEIKEYNQNVEVLPNSIWDRQEQFILNPKPSEKVRIGYITASHHTKDAILLTDGLKEVYKDVSHNKFQICLGGFYVQDKLAYINDVLSKGNNDAETVKRFNFFKLQLEQGNDVPNVMIWNNHYDNIPHFLLYEFYMTAGGKYFNKELNKNLESNYYVGTDSDVYRRLYGLPANEYARLYNEIDVALVPLKENRFANCKSQLKIIEAGWFKKAVIVSNIKPYTLDCTNQNTILINPDKRNSGWGVAIKSLILNKNKREDLSESLHQHIKANYDMNIVNIKRKQLYDNLCQ